MSEATRPTLFGSIQGLVQLITGGGIVATAFGFGAMYLQFERYGIPMSLLSFEQAARAGLLPTAGLIVVVVYGYLAVRLPSFAFASILATGFIPSLIPIIVLGMILLLGELAGIIWFFDYIIGDVAESIGVPISATLRFLAAHGILLVFAGLVWVTAIVQRRLAAASDPGLPPAASSIAGGAATAGTDGSGSPSAQAESQWWIIAPVIVLSVPVVIGALFGLRWYLARIGIADTLVRLMSARTIFALAGIWAFSLLLLCCTVILVDLRERLRGFIGWIATALAGITFLVALTLYWSLLYPVLSSGLGGGRPERVTVWIDGDDLSLEARNRLPPGSCAEAGKLVRCDGVSSIPVGGSYLVLAGARPPALVIKRDSVKVLTLGAP